VLCRYCPASACSTCRKGALAERRFVLLLAPEGEAAAAAIGEAAAARRVTVVGIVLAGGSAVMPGMVELAEDIFLKPVRKGLPLYHGALHDMVANPRSATVMGLLEEARIARSRGQKAARQAGSVKTVLGRAKDWFLGNF
jgi:cell division ATPase FtsA